MNPYQALMERFARTRWGARVFVPIATAIDRRIIRWSKGKLTSGAGTTHNDNIFLLCVRGAKTGQPRTVPLLGTPVDDGIVVIASNGGAPKHPAWYFNLTKNPECEVEVRGVRSRRIARVTAGAERERCWAAAVALYPGYSSYADRAGREIPVVVLERAPEA
jgi:deazaflavin-dependent oxidoreductase (nitroreductase family)